MDDPHIIKMEFLNDTAIPLHSPQGMTLIDLALGPGYSAFVKAFSAYTGIDLQVYIPAILLYVGFLYAFRTISNSVWRIATTTFMSHAEIRIDDEMYNHVMAWISQQTFSSRCRQFIVQESVKSRAFSLLVKNWRYGDWDQDEEDEGEIVLDDEGLPIFKKKGPKPLNYTPGVGTHFFWYNYRPFFFHRVVPGYRSDVGSYIPASEKEEISISYLGRDATVLKALLTEARLVSEKADRNKTLIYRGASKPGAGNTDFAWTRSLSRVARPIGSVVMDEDLKKEILADIAEYLMPRTRRWYANRGIPYRRGYLLYGAPGTGKSSLSLALAGRFGLAIYIVSLNSPMMNEENLASLFSELPTRCVVLLEDIDTAGLTHTREEEDEPVVKKVKKSSEGSIVVAEKEKEGKISLSALLNVLDGVASQEGRVLIMTTNHVDKLDEALVRPGRVDMKIEFKLADCRMMGSLFRSIFTKVAGDDAVDKKKEVKEQRPKWSEFFSSRFGGQHPDTDERAEAEVNGSAKKEYKGTKEEQARLLAIDEADKAEKEALAKEEARIETERIKCLSDRFANIMPEHEFSPAEVQGYLLKHKREPEIAIQGALKWCVDTREEKKKRAEKEEKDKAEKEKKRKEKEAKEKEEKAKKAKMNGVKKSDSDSSESEESESEGKSESKKK